MRGLDEVLAHQVVNSLPVLSPGTWFSKLFHDPIVHDASHILLKINPYCTKCNLMNLDNKRKDTAGVYIYFSFLLVNIIPFYYE